MPVSAQNTSNVKFYQAEISFQTAKWDQSLKEFNLLLADSQVSQIGHIYYRVSQCHEKLGNVNLAINMAENAVKTDSLQEEYLFHWARLLELKYRYTEAWPIRKKLLEAQPRYISRFFASIDNARNRNDHQEVLSLAQRWIDQFGRNLYITEIISESYLKLNQKQKAILAYDSLILKYPNRDEYVQKRKFLTETKTDNTLSQGFNTERKAISEAMKLLDVGNPKEAYQILQEAVKEDPENLQAHKLQFLSAYLDNNIEGLKKVLENIYILYPFLEDVQKTAEWIIAFKNNKNTGLDIDKLLFTAEWEFIRIDVHLKMGQLTKAKSIWSNIQQNVQLNKIIPSFYKKQINEQINKK